MLGVKIPPYHLVGLFSHVVFVLSLERRLLCSPRNCTASLEKDFSHYWINGSSIGPISKETSSIVNTGTHTSKTHKLLEFLYSSPPYLSEYRIPSIARLLTAVF